jgi:beta-galactosidase
MFASKQAPFLITETNAGAIGGPSVNFPAYDGQWRQAAWAFVARGAEMIEYWHWHTNHFGTETYWIGILPHDQQPGRVYDVLARLGRDFQVAGSQVVGLEPDARVGLLYSARAKWGLAFQSSFPSPTAAGPSDVANMDRRSYHTIFDAFYRGTFEAGVPARLLHDEHLVDADGTALIDPAELAARLPVLIVPGLLVADNALLDWLRAYAAAGGHLVLGPRTAYGDEEGRARTEVKPARLADVAGVRYQEFSNLNDPLPLVAPSGAFVLSPGATATRWVDGLITEGAEVLVGYRHPHFGQFPTVVSQVHGRGRITTVGTVPDPVFGADLARWLAPEARWPGLPDSVTVSSATNRSGRRIHVVHNWSWDPVQVQPPQPLADLLTGEAAVLERVDLGAWDVRVLGDPA